MNNIRHLKAWKYTGKDLKINKFRGKKIITEEIAKQIKESVVDGLKLKDIKEKIKEEIQNGRNLEYICKTFKVSNSTFYRLNKDLNQN